MVAVRSGAWFFFSQRHTAGAVWDFRARGAVRVFSLLNASATRFWSLVCNTFSDTTLERFASVVVEQRTDESAASLVGHPPPTFPNPKRWLAAKFRKLRDSHMSNTLRGARDPVRVEHRAARSPGLVTRFSAQQYAGAMRFAREYRRKKHSLFRRPTLLGGMRENGSAPTIF
jgi:hypothetical protein